ncbi:acyl-CoA dehydrogenase [Pandoraea thiooxydans]|uniref:Acyl-CoA dehydrogenase n=1 Tax=Pandoraea thiooxydans TaxID=445709 RepID=A0A0G3EPP4_9BURK|nr:acyl-CoA dehydrogenase family protein [Pandoraea thiooxydans]AKJ67312.1 acyl-CoA dehydrogenase [Pandoraea thiooxydans]APR94323.1 acyl-CoA dehydrogenase [Pandoraea thiooxydans]
MIEPLALVGIPAEDQALRDEVRAFLQTSLPAVPADVRARSWMGFDADFSRALGRHGWLGLTLPREYGGSERGAFARFVLSEELLNAGAPVGAHWIADRQSGPLIATYGTAAQKALYLPKICRGEAFFCIGMSEPNAGSDLASVRTRAEKTAHGWRLSGQKIWTTQAHRSHYMIALVRTSASTAERHAGLSQFIIDLKLPGITVRPITDLAGDQHFCEVFFDNVELADDALIGTEGSGWQQVTAELAFERSGPERIYSSIVVLNEWIDLLRRRGQVREPARIAAGRLLAQLATLRAMSVAITAKLAAGQSPVTEAALTKDLGTEFEQAIPIVIGDLLDNDADGAAPPAELLRALAYVTHVAPSYSLRGGTREILRGMIARGLGLR